MRLRMRMMAAMPTAMMVGLVVRRNGGSFGCRRLPPPPGEESVAADIASTEIRSRLESRTVAGPPLKSMAAGLCGLDGISRLLCSAELAVSHFCCRRSVFPQQQTDRPLFQRCTGLTLCPPRGRCPPCPARSRSRRHPRSSTAYQVRTKTCTLKRGSLKTSSFKTGSLKTGYFKTGSLKTGSF